MSSVSNVVICAAGAGSSLGLSIPQSLATVAGRPLIHCQLDLLENIENVTVVVGHQAAAVMRTVMEIRSDTRFIINHDYKTASPLDSLRMAVREMDEPFVYMDSDLLVGQDSLDAISEFPLIAAGINRTSSDDPVCVEFQEGKYGKQITGFVHEPRDFEWTGLAKLTPEVVLSAEGSEHVYQALEKIMPVAAIEIECPEKDTIGDLETFKQWNERRMRSRKPNRIALAA